MKGSIHAPQALIHAIILRRWSFHVRLRQGLLRFFRWRCPQLVVWQQKGILHLNGGNFLSCLSSSSWAHFRHGWKGSKWFTSRLELPFLPGKIHFSSFSELQGIFWYLLVSFENGKKIPKGYQKIPVSFEIFPKIPKDTGIFWYLLNISKRYRYLLVSFWYLFTIFKRYQKIPKDTRTYVTDFVIKNMLDNSHQTVTILLDAAQWAAITSTQTFTIILLDAAQWAAVTPTKHWSWWGVVP